MTVEFTGKVQAVLPLATGVGKNGPWARATVVFAVPNGRFEDKIACENTKEAEAFSKLQVGQTVKVNADLSSREYNGRWYTSLVCYRFSVEGGQPAPSESDDMPF